MNDTATPKSKRVDGQVTGLAGELFVAAELLKRGIQTSITFGNAKAIDLLAHNPETGRNFTIQVKAIRFYLMALGKSRQTSLMLKLEKKHDLVFYVAPAFHKASELNAHFASLSVDGHSRSIRPSRIKKMPDKLEHFVSYRLSGPCHRFSDDPAIVEEQPEDLPAAIQSAAAREMNAASVLESLLSILDGRGGPPKSRFAEIVGADRDPTVAAQFVARTFFGCELAFFHRARPNNSFKPKPLRGSA